MPLPKPQPEWMLELRVGDVLTDGKSFRVVRSVTFIQRRYGKRLLAVNFTIKRCSWTRRCHTTLTAVDLNRRNFRPAGIRVKLNKPIDKEIDHCVNADGGRENQTLRCCDVIGIS